MSDTRRLHRGRLDSLRRRVVFVTGPPGAGKSTLAVPLAAELGFVLISKDDIKELLSDVLSGPTPDLAWSRRLGAAAMELVWELAQHIPAVVLDANFRPDTIRPEQMKSLGASTVEVRCDCPKEVAARRYNERAASRHPVHVLAHLSVPDLTEYDRPVGAARRMIVDTTVPVDVVELAQRVRDVLGLGG